MSPQAYVFDAGLAILKRSGEGALEPEAELGGGG